MMPDNRIDSQPRTIGELARYYNVDKKTFKKWLSCKTLGGIHPENGNFFSIAQIKTIINHLGYNE